ncbi:hypothetical protein ScPMuIL_000824 [Solemya velum]
MLKYTDKYICIEKDIDEEPDITVAGIGIGAVLGAVVALVTVYVCYRVRTGISHKREVTELNTIAVDEPNDYDTLGASRENENNDFGLLNVIIIGCERLDNLLKDSTHYYNKKLIKASMDMGRVPRQGFQKGRQN